MNYKLFILFVFLLIGLNSVLGYSNTSLKYYWDMDEADHTSTITDRIQNNILTTDHSQDVFRNNGCLKGACLYGGSTSTIQFFNNTFLGYANTSFTINGWFYDTDGTTGAQHFLIITQDTSNYYYVAFEYQGLTTLDMAGVMIYNTGYSYNTTNTTLFNNNYSNWHMGTITYNNNSHDIKYYLDGIYLWKTNKNLNLTKANILQLQLFKNTATDEISLWDTNLSDQDINLLYNNRTGLNLQQTLSQNNTINILYNITTHFCLNSTWSCELGYNYTNGSLICDPYGLPQDCYFGCSRGNCLNGSSDNFTYYDTQYQLIANNTNGSIVYTGVNFCLPYTDKSLCEYGVMIKNNQTNISEMYCNINLISYCSEACLSLINDRTSGINYTNIFNRTCDYFYTLLASPYKAIYCPPVNIPRTNYTFRTFSGSLVSSFQLIADTYTFYNNVFNSVSDCEIQNRVTYLNEFWNKKTYQCIPDNAEQLARGNDQHDFYYYGSCIDTTSSNCTGINECSNLNEKSCNNQTSFKFCYKDQVTNCYKYAVSNCPGSLICSQDTYSCIAPTGNITINNSLTPEHNLTNTPPIQRYIVALVILILTIIGIFVLTDKFNIDPRSTSYLLLFVCIGEIILFTIIHMLEWYIVVMMIIIIIGIFALKRGK
jgi:hypothetical protein